MIFQWIKIKGKGWEIAEVYESYWNCFNGTAVFLSVEKEGPILSPPTEYMPTHKFNNPVPKLSVQVEELQKDEVYSGWIEDFVEVKSKRPNDCAVVTVANILQISYREARIISLHGGFTTTIGSPIGMVEAILQEKGYKLNFREDLSRGSVDSFYARGLFTVNVQNHTMPSVNGNLLNIQGCELQTITEVFEVCK